MTQLLNNFFRSVVGKLWYTIILLVVVVLFVLTILLLEFFQNYYVNQAEEQLTNMANKVASIMEEYDEREAALATSWEIVDFSSVNTVIIANKQQFWYSPDQDERLKLPIDTFFHDRQLTRVFHEQEKVVMEDEFLIDDKESEMIVVGVPVQFAPNENGAVFLYQSLDVVQNTMKQVTKIIYISAGIAIMLTTFFAFFLSSRIAAPLRKMKEAVSKAAKGEFNTKVPIITSDEIGELAVAFNSMGEQLRNYITALNQEKEQLASILSSMADGVITFDRNGSILVTNPPADRFLQAWYYEQGMKPNGSEDVPADIRALFQEVVTTEKEQSVEVMTQGRSWWIVMTPLYDQSYVRGAVAVLRDITEERRLDKLREDFIANVSHELRTPIAMLQGYSEAIVDNVAESEEEKREIGKIIYDESLRMGRLVNELLDLARMESGHIELNYKKVDIISFAERVMRKFQGLAKERDIHLSFHKSVDEKPMRIDPDRIEQVLTNLIDNAIRHTAQNGEVKIRVDALDSGAKFEIIDNGSGIPQEDLPFVFERFYKADKARTRGRSGTGLGLAIAKNIVEAHGGHIFVHSTVNVGTTFTFYLPDR